MIDLHSHILPGIDDGAKTLADSVQIARDAVAAGVETLVATPHVRADYPNDAETIHRAVAATRGELDASGIALELLPGAELDLDYHATLDEEELARLGLGGNPRLLLIEFPYTGWPVALAETLAKLRLRGVTAVLAHPERNPEVQAGPARLQPLTEAGTLVQLTAGSVVGSLGKSAQAAAHALLDLGLAHVVASDVHSMRHRVSTDELLAALDHDEALVRWLTIDVPAAALRGEELPSRPPRRRGRLRSGLRFRTRRS